MSDNEQTAGAEHNRFLIALLGGDDPAPSEPEADTPPDFDGGVREPVPDEPDPERDHNALMAELAQLGGGGQLE